MGGTKLRTVPCRGGYEPGGAATRHSSADALDELPREHVAASVGFVFCRQSLQAWAIGKMPGHPLKPGGSIMKRSNQSKWWGSFISLQQCGGRSRLLNAISLILLGSVSAAYGEEPRSSLPAAVRKTTVLLKDGRQAETDGHVLMLVDADGRKTLAPPGIYNTREGRSFHVNAFGIHAGAGNAHPATHLPVVRLPGSIKSNLDIEARRKSDPKSPAHDHGKTAKAKMITWEYLRLNHPQAVMSFVHNVQDGKLEHAAIAGLVRKEFRPALIQNTPRRGRTIAPRPGPERISRKDSPHEKLVKADPIIKMSFGALYGGSITTYGGTITPKKVNIDEGEKNLGDFAIGAEPSFVFEEMIPSECDFKVFCISKDFRILQIATLTGEMETVNGKLVEKTEKVVHGPKSPAVMHIKAGQSFRIVLAVTQEAANSGPGDALAGWSVDSPLASYSGALKCHYYQDGIGCVAKPEGGVLNLIQGGSTYLPVQVSNAAPKGRTVSLKGLDVSGGVNVEPQMVTLGPKETRTVNLHVTVASDALETRSAWMSVQASDGSVSGTCGLSTNVYLPFYTWSIDGSCGKIDHHSDISVAGNGLWHWSGHMHDNSTWYGDDYDYLFFFGQATPDGKNLGMELQGSLGAEYSGPAVDCDINVSGLNTDIKQHFGGYADHGIGWHISVADDISQILKPVAEWLVANGIALALLL